MTAKPRAKGGIRIAKHSKRGHHFVTALDPDSMQVTLLEPWEHDVLVLCDGTLEVEVIAELLAAGLGDHPVDLPAVRDAVERFGSYRLLEDGGPAVAAGLGIASPRTLAHLQQAYREWHKDPWRIGQILIGGLTPFVRVDGVAAGLEPTVALPAGADGADGWNGPEVPGGCTRASVAVGTTLVVSESGAELRDPGRSITSLLSDTNASGCRFAPSREIPRPRSDESRERYPLGTELPRAVAKRLESDRVTEGVGLQNVSELLRAVDHEFARLEGFDEPVRLVPPRMDPGDVEPPYSPVSGTTDECGWPAPPRSAPPTDAGGSAAEEEG